MVSHCGYNLPFSDNQWFWTYFMWLLTNLSTFWCICSSLLPILTSDLLKVCQILKLLCSEQSKLSAHLVKAIIFTTPTKRPHNLPPRNAWSHPNHGSACSSCCSRLCPQQPSKCHASLCPLRECSHPIFPPACLLTSFSAFWNILHETAATSSAFSLPLMQFHFFS